jgi:hypothetical protein
MARAICRCWLALSAAKPNKVATHSTRRDTPFPDVCWASPGTSSGINPTYQSRAGGRSLFEKQIPDLVHFVGSSEMTQASIQLL